MPEGTSRALREGALALSNAARIEIFEMRQPDVVMQRVDPADAGNLESYLVPHSEIENTIAIASETSQRIRSMLPGNTAAITTCVPPQSGAVAFCFRGASRAMAGWS